MNEIESIAGVAAETEEKFVRQFATVGEVFEDGVSLLFDGEESATEKHYLCNTNCYFAPGDRVRIIEDSGTYIVEYVVGKPRMDKLVGVPSGGAKDAVLAKNSEADHDLAWVNGVPVGGAKDDVLAKKSTTDHDYKWAKIVGIPKGGAAGAMIVKGSGTDYDVKWVNGIPKGGVTGYILTKKSISDYDFEWEPGLPTGGAKDEILAKKSATDNDFKWVKVVGIPSGGAKDAVLAKNSATDHDVKWVAGVPITGTTGHVLTKTSSGMEWAENKSAKLKNPGATSTLAQYDIEIRSTSIYSSTSPTFEIRMAGGAWKKITLTN